MHRQPRRLVEHDEALVSEQLDRVSGRTRHWLHGLCEREFVRRYLINSCPAKASDQTPGTAQTSKVAAPCRSSFTGTYSGEFQNAWIASMDGNSNMAIRCSP